MPGRRSTLNRWLSAADRSDGSTDAQPFDPQAAMGRRMAERRSGTGYRVDGARRDRSLSDRPGICRIP